jgi:uncharacterized protein (DUF1501 family)
MKKSNDRDLLLSRRAFLRQTSCAALGITGVVNTLAHLTLTRAALAQTLPGDDYKALVVVFLYGGNDSNNMLIPLFGHPAYADYKANRGILGIWDPADPQYVPTRPASISLGANGEGLGLHPALQPLANLFAAGELAFVANTGTLAFPLTRSQYLANSVPLPIQLFSHSDQQIEWQSSVADKPFQSGWGGRVADLLKQEGYAGNKVSLSITISGINSFQVGSDVVQYTVSPTGAVALAGFGSSSSPYSNAKNADGSYRTTSTGQRLKAFDEITAYTHQHLLEEGYVDVMRRARAGEGIVGSAFTAAAQSGVDLDAVFASATTSLGSQLKTVAKLIAGRSTLDNRRQIFFCSVGGFDTHSDQLTSHGNLMTELGNSLSAFSQALVALGVNDNVLTLTHSDFTRTFTPNGTDAATAGSDHGWGGHHIVLGGPVRGGKIYGAFPSLRVSADQDAGTSRGRWIPTTSVDQYAAVAARWLGVESGALSAIFPNLHRFEDPFGAAANLGFVEVGA